MLWALYDLGRIVSRRPRTPPVRPAASRSPGTRKCPSVAGRPRVGPSVFGTLTAERSQRSDSGSSSNRGMTCHARALVAAGLDGFGIAGLSVTAARDLVILCFPARVQPHNPGSPESTGSRAQHPGAVAQIRVFRAWPVSCGRGCGGEPSDGGYVGGERRRAVEDAHRAAGTVRRLRRPVSS